MFCFCESGEKRPNSVRSKFADASISPLVEDWGCSAASEALQHHLLVELQNKDVIGKIFPALNEQFCFCESNEKWLNSIRSQFADASISRLIEDWGCSKVQPSYRLSKVRGTRAALETLTWRKYETMCKSWKRFLFYFQCVKGKENSKLCMCCLKNHTQYFYLIVTWYDTPNPR